MKSSHLVASQSVPATLAMDSSPQLQPSPAARTPDRRKPGPRYSVDNVRGKLGPIRNAEVLNISLGGFAVETAKYLQIGHSYPVSLVGPTEVTVTAEVVWCRMTATVRNLRNEIEPVFRAGFKFLDLTRKDRSKLRQLIRRSSTEAACQIADHPEPKPA